MKWSWRRKVIIIFLYGLGRLTCSGIDPLPSFPRASTIFSFSRFVVEGVFRKSGVAHSFKMDDPVLFVFGFHVLYSRDEKESTSGNITTCCGEILVQAETQKYYYVLW